MNDKELSELRDKIAALEAEIDQAQAWIDDGRKLENQPPSFVMQMDQCQLRLNRQRADVARAKKGIALMESDN